MAHVEKEMTSLTQPYVAVIMLIIYAFLVYDSLCFLAIQCLFFPFTTGEKIAHVHSLLPKQTKV